MSPFDYLTSPSTPPRSRLTPSRSTNTKKQTQDTKARGALTSNCPYPRSVSLPVYTGEFNAPHLPLRPSPSPRRPPFSPHTPPPPSRLSPHCHSPSFRPPLSVPLCFSSCSWLLFALRVCVYVVFSVTVREPRAVAVARSLFARTFPLFLILDVADLRLCCCCCSLSRYPFLLLLFFDPSLRARCWRRSFFFFVGFHLAAEPPHRAFPSHAAANTFFSDPVCAPLPRCAPPQRFTPPCPATPSHPTWSLFAQRLHQHIRIRAQASSLVVSPFWSIGSWTTHADGECLHPRDSRATHKQQASTKKKRGWTVLCLPHVLFPACLLSSLRVGGLSATPGASLSRFSLPSFFQFSVLLACSPLARSSPPFSLLASSSSVSE